jgi:hypothetical protein
MQINVNDLLQSGLKLYFYHLKKGQVNKANLILSLTSQVANQELTASGIRKTYTKYQDPNQETNYDKVYTEVTNG